MKKAFKKENRIRKREEFRTLYRKATVAQGKYLSLRLWTCDLKNSGTQPKIAITVSRQTSKFATQRNLWRRRIREVFRTHQYQIKPRTWVWVRVTSEDKAPIYSIIQEELMGLIKKTNAIIN